MKKRDSVVMVAVLRSGGTITLRYSGNPFDLDVTERAFLFDLVDQLQYYQARHPEAQGEGLDGAAGVVVGSVLLEFDADAEPPPPPTCQRTATTASTAPPTEVAGRNSTTTTGIIPTSTT